MDHPNPSSATKLRNNHAQEGHEIANTNVEEMEEYSDSCSSMSEPEGNAISLRDSVPPNYRPAIEPIASPDASPNLEPKGINSINDIPVNSAPPTSEFEEPSGSNSWVPTDTYFARPLHTRIWRRAFEQETCSRTPTCRVQSHKRMGIFAPGHGGSFAVELRYALLYALTMVITSVSAGIRFCLPCRSLGKVCSGSLSFMLRHTRDEHGDRLKSSPYLSQLIVNIHALRGLNPGMRPGCPLRVCTVLCFTPVELFLHFIIEHQEYSTAQLVVCPFCWTPLLGKSVEAHARERGTLHNRGCCQQRFPTLQKWLCHELNYHTYQFCKALPPSLRENLLAEIYSNSAVTAWAKSCPLLLQQNCASINLEMPELWDEMYLTVQQLPTALSIVENVFDRGHDPSLSLRILDRCMGLSDEQKALITSDLSREYFYKKLRNLIDNQTLHRGLGWVKEISGLSLEAQLKARNTRSWCYTCQDSQSHENDPSSCFDRLKAESLASKLLPLELKGLLPIKDGLLVARGQSLFGFGPTGRSQWLNLSSMAEHDTYGRVYTSAGIRIYSDDCSLTENYQNYFEHIKRVLELTNPPPTTPVVVEYFSKLITSPYLNISTDSIYLEVSAYFCQLKKMGSYQFWVLLPLPEWNPGFTQAEYLSKLRLARDAGAIAAMVGTKIRISCVPTIGILEGQPLLNNNTNVANTWLNAACADPPIPIVPTRNVTGTPSRVFMARFSTLLDTIAEAHQHTAKILLEYKHQHYKIAPAYAHLEASHIEECFPEERQHYHRARVRQIFLWYLQPP